MDNFTEKSRFATQNEFRQGLHSIKLSEASTVKNGAGIPLLCEQNDGDKTIYVDTSDAHSLILGATGSKKTRLVIMPSILLCAKAEESFVVVDPKGELYNRTAQRIDDSGYNVITIDFRNPATSDAWNPLFIPFRHFRNGEFNKAYEFLNEVARSVFAGKDIRDPYWADSALQLFVGLSLFLFEQNKSDNEGYYGVSIKDVLKLRHEIFRPTAHIGNFDRELTWAETSGFSNFLYQKYPLVHRNLSNAVEAPPRTRASILGYFDLYTEVFSMHEDLLRMTAKTTFEFADLANTKTAIYIIIPDEKPTYHLLASMFIKQCYDSLIAKASEMPDIRFENRINFIVDEFASLPYIPSFPTMITASRSRNIRFHLVAQSRGQLSQRYGDETETIMSNCSNWIFLFSREAPLLKDIQFLGGKTSEGRDLISTSLLQNLLKEVNVAEEGVGESNVQLSESEVLVFCGRKRPYITHLFDINHYDFNDIPPIRKKPVCEDVTEKRFNIFEYWKSVVATQGEQKHPQKPTIPQLPKNKVLRIIALMFQVSFWGGVVGIAIDIFGNSVLSGWERGLVFMAVIYLITDTVAGILRIRPITTKSMTFLSILGITLLLNGAISVAGIIMGILGSIEWAWWGWNLLILFAVYAMYSMIVGAIVQKK